MNQIAVTSRSAMEVKPIILVAIFSLSVVLAAQIPNATRSKVEDKFASLKAMFSGNSSDLASYARMYRGSDSEWKDLTFLAHVLIWNEKTKWRFQCTGFMVTKQIMITTKRCLDRWDGDVTDVITRLAHNWGATSTKFDYGSWYRTYRVMRHPGFTDTRASVDLALIKADKPIETIGRHAYNQPWANLEPLKLPLPGEDKEIIDDDNTLLDTAGVGSTVGYEWGQRRRLRRAHLKLFNDRCAYDWMLKIDTKRQVCSKLDKFRYCSGDQGAPIYKETPRGKVVFAMLSHTLYYCTEDQYKRNDVIIASRLSGDMPWILAKIAKHTQDHGLDELMAKWKDVPYPKKVLEDESMDIEGVYEDFNN